MTQAGTIPVTKEDFEILAYTVGVDAWCGYAEANARDGQHMFLRERDSRLGYSPARLERNLTGIYPLVWLS